jgi:hypothetical protein
MKTTRGAHEIDVIIRTTAERHRRAQLFRALDTIRNQAGVNATPIVVVNGDRFDADLVDELKAIDDIVFDYMAEGSLIGSRLRGRELVTAPFFTYLDDDDELVPDTLQYPAEWLATHTEHDAVINDIYRSVRGAVIPPKNNADQKWNILVT